MVGSFVVGALLTFLGALCVVAGVTVGVVDALRPRPSREELAVKDVIKIGELVRDILKAFGTLKPAAQLLAVGTLLLGGGIALLYARPF